MPPGPLAQPRPALRLRCTSSSEPSQAPRHRNLQGTRSPPLDAQTRATAPLWLLPGGTTHQGHASVPSCPSWTAHVAGKPRGPTRVGRANRARPGRQSVLALWQGVRLAFSGPPKRATTATVAPTQCHQRSTQPECSAPASSQADGPTAHSFTQRVRFGGAWQEIPAYPRANPTPASFPSLAETEWSAVFATRSALELAVQIERAREGEVFWHCGKACVLPSRGRRGEQRPPPSPRRGGCQLRYATLLYAVLLYSFLLLSTLLCSTLLYSTLTLVSRRIEGGQMLAVHPSHARKQAQSPLGVELSCPLRAPTSMPVEKGSGVQMGQI